MLIDPARAAYDKLQASVSEYRKTSPYSRDKPYGEALTFEDFKTRYDAGTDFRQPTYSGQPMQPLQSASGGLGGLQLSNGVGPRPTIGNLGQEYKSDDPIRQGFFDSTFFKPNAISTADMANYTYNGKSMQGSSSQIGQFGNYLDSIGKGDLLQRQDKHVAQQPGIGSLLGSTPGENPFRIKSIEEREQIAEEMNNSGGGLMGTDGNRVPVTWEQVGDGRNTMPSMPIKPGNSLFPFPGMNNTETATVPLPSFNQFTPPEIPLSMQQPMTPTMPQNTMGGNNSFDNPLMGGINSLSEFGKPPSLGGNNSFGNPFMGNILGGNNSFQPNQQSFNDNQGLNSYVDNMVNGRLKDIFGGIMGLFK